MKSPADFKIVVLFPHPKNCEAALLPPTFDKASTRLTPAVVSSPPTISLLTPVPPTVAAAVVTIHSSYAPLQDHTIDALPKNQDHQKRHLFYF